MRGIVREELIEKLEKNNWEVDKKKREVRKRDKTIDEIKEKVMRM